MVAPAVVSYKWQKAVSGGGLLGRPGSEGGPACRPISVLHGQAFPLYLEGWAGDGGRDGLRLCDRRRTLRALLAILLVDLMPDCCEISDDRVGRVWETAGWILHGIGAWVA